MTNEQLKRRSALLKKITGIVKEEVEHARGYEDMLFFLRITDVIDNEANRLEDIILKNT